MGKMIECCRVLKTGEPSDLSPVGRLFEGSARYDHRSTLLFPAAFAIGLLYLDATAVKSAKRGIIHGKRCKSELSWREYSDIFETEGLKLAMRGDFRAGSAGQEHVADSSSPVLTLSKR